MNTNKILYAHARMLNVNQLNMVHMTTYITLYIRRQPTMAYVCKYTTCIYVYVIGIRLKGESRFYMHFQTRLNTRQNAFDERKSNIWLFYWLAFIPHIPHLHFLYTYMYANTHTD